MPRYAAIDIGSNSLRLLIAEVTPGAPPVTLAEERKITRLGASVFRDGEVSQDAMGMVCGVLAGMARICEQQHVVGIRAVATAAVRDASNQGSFLANASAAIGTPVEVISGQEEARLIQLGVQSRWPNRNGRELIVDVGGGSAEIILTETGKIRKAFSKQIGALRLTQVFLASDPPEPRELHQMDEFIGEKIAPAVARIGRGDFVRAVATSASAGAMVSAANRIPRSRRDEVDRKRATIAQVRKLRELLAGKDLDGRRGVTGIGPRRAELIVAGVSVFLRVMEVFSVPEIHYSAAGVRDGVIVDLAERGVGREQSRLSPEQRQVVEAMARKYGMSMEHARKVAEFSNALFDSLQPLHKVPPNRGKLLEAAAYLHDVGHFVSDTAHHKHSAYLVANSEMPGFSSQERILISQLCRYHRKATPKPRHQAYEQLPDSDKHAVTRLAPLLRLADNLDRSHEQRIEVMECQLRDDCVVLYLNSDADTDLEQWAVERASDFFHESYGLPVALVKTAG